MAARCDFLMRGETARVCDARALGWAREAIVGERRASLIDSRATIMAGKTWEAVYCVAVVVVMFAALLKNVAGPDVLMLGALAMELAAGIVGVDDGLRGFSNKGLLTVACYFKGCLALEFQQVTHNRQRITIQEVH